MRQYILIAFFSWLSMGSVAQIIIESIDREEPGRGPLDDDGPVLIGWDIEYHETTKIAFVSQLYKYRGKSRVGLRMESFGEYLKANGYSTGETPTMVGQKYCHPSTTEYTEDELADAQRARDRQILNYKNDGYSVTEVNYRWGPQPQMQQGTSSEKRRTPAQKEDVNKQQERLAREQQERMAQAQLEVARREQEEKETDEKVNGMSEETFLKRVRELESGALSVVPTAKDAKPIITRKISGSEKLSREDALKALNAIFYEHRQRGWVSSDLSGIQYHQVQRSQYYGKKKTTWWFCTATYQGPQQTPPSGASRQ